jgi:catechol 2,3-dioxygenase-like lactoylglutathione lyase family enzyme
MSNSPALTRREALALFAASACAARAADAPFTFAALDHIEFTVTDAEKSRDFYTRIFGNTVLKNSTRPKRYIKLGSTYMAFDPAPEIRVDHFCVSIKGFDMGKVHAHLDQQRIMYRDYPSGRDTAVTDPDGTRLQLAPENGWSSLASPNFAPESVALREPPIFRPTGMEHILLNVTDPEKSAAFYEKFLGPVSQRNNNRIWFQLGASRVGLLQTPSGQRAGVNHYCVSAEPFNYDEVMKKLQQAGVKIEPAEVAGAPDFRDPDGYRVQVMGPRAPA